MPKIIICGHGKVPKSLLEEIARSQGLEEIEIIESMQEIKSQTNEKGIPLVDLEQLKYENPIEPQKHKKGRRGRKRRTEKYF